MKTTTTPITEQNNKIMTEQELKELTTTKEFRDFIQDLAYYAMQYVVRIRLQLTSAAVNLYQDETIRKMLREYRERNEKDLHDITSDMLHRIGSPESDCWNLESRSGANHYSQVLYDLIVRD